MKLLFLALTVSLMAGLSFAEEVVREENVTAVLQSNDEVAIFNVNGDISVSGWDSDEVEVVYTITCDSQEEMDAIDVVCDLSDGILCEVEFDDDWDDEHRSEVVFQIKVPEDLALEFELADVNGDVTVASASGTAHLEVVNGDIEASEFDGELFIALVNGSVNTDRISELREIEIVNGDITVAVNEMMSDIMLSSVNGEIVIDLTTDALVEIETLSGDIEVGEIFNAVIDEDIVGASTAFGSGEYSIEVSTVSGDIEVSD